ncbi:DNA-binding transcriptional regulator, LacI/PurR family [Lachnospiraceae bacterium NK3A20]|nr:DNA-binding transcriptional regulator, LacI/PurR family [Lachnospiraceae bacterium NK3A20]
MPVTIKDIAREAGVSVATVSKVLNNKRHISPATQKKISEVIERLNYVPNASAANLARKSSRNILYADSFYKGLPYKNPHMFDIICGVSHELSRKGYQLSLLNLESYGKKPKEIFEETILSHIADGIILNSFYTTPQIERLLLQHDFPQICIGKPDFDSMLSWIDTNHALSSRVAVDHLVACGCRKIAFIGGQKDDKIFMERLRGFRSSMDKIGLEVQEKWISYNKSDVNAVYESVSRLLEAPEIPDGIICTNSLTTVGAMRAIEKKGIAIPDKISLIAFDDYPYSPAISVAPTIIDIDLFNLGVHAGNLLLKKIRNPEMLIQTYTALPHLIERQTTHVKNA